MCNQAEMPIVEAIRKYLGKDYLRLHMPGHKGKCAPNVYDVLGDKPFLADLTELPGTDDLHAPVEAILEAEKLAADLFGAGGSVFVVNGATQGIIALMMQDEGKKIILPRHAHKALYNGLILSGATPEYIKPRFLPEWGIATGVDFDHYCSLAAHNLDVTQVWLTSPTYFGHMEDIRLFKKYLPDEAKLFIDEAHGSHLRFLGKEDAITQGAHAAVQSWHKTLGALTQSAVIHFSDKDFAAQIRRTIALTETTSPSYLLLASLDSARQNMALNGEKLLKSILTNTEKLRVKLSKLKFIDVMPTDDITKIAISLDGLSGYQLYQALIEKGIMPEMASEKFVLLQATLYFNSEQVEQIINALQNVAIPYIKYQFQSLQEISIPKLMLTPREAFYAKHTVIPFASAKGKICAEFIIPYPPGIPLIAPGEMVDEEILDNIRKLKRAGVKFQGMQDKDLKNLTVVKE